MRGFRFGALELVSSPLVREDNVASAPKGKRRMRIRCSVRNLFHESPQPGAPGRRPAGNNHGLWERVRMRGFPFGALELVPFPFVQKDNVATAPKGKRRMRIRCSVRNLFHESPQPGAPGRGPARNSHGLWERVCMRGFSFGALELVPSPLVREDNVATAPKGKRRMQTRCSAVEICSMKVRNPARRDEDRQGTAPDYGKEFACGAFVSAR